MKLLRISLCCIASLWFATRAAFGWGTPSHEAIAGAAMSMLKGTPAAAKIDAILQDETPANAAIWLDQVRERVRFADPAANAEAAQFEKNFPKNSGWHFTDYVVGSSKYELDGLYSADNDVVHALENAIAVLEGAPSKMTKLEALRVVMHLTGDLHQPLHCTTGFYDLDDMHHPKALTKVKDPSKTPQDRGGNQLYYSLSQEMHALWDVGLPSRIGEKVSGLTAAITTDDFASQPLTAGDYHHWPEVWASDTMAQGAAAYKGITFNSAAFVKNPQHPSETMLKISVSLPGGTVKYKTVQTVRAKAQLQKAAVHLAQLLSQIHYK